MVTIPRLSPAARLILTGLTAGAVVVAGLVIWLRPDGTVDEDDSEEETPQGPVPGQARLGFDYRRQELYYPGNDYGFDPTAIYTEEEIAAAWASHTRLCDLIEALDPTDPDIENHPTCQEMRRQLRRIRTIARHGAPD